MARRNLGNVVAAGDVDGLVELGKLVTYSLTDEPKAGTKLVRAWADAGLDVNDLPTQRSGTDIFRSACRSVETRRGSRGVEVKVDEVLHNSTECVYQITRLVRDEANRVIEHPKALTIAYNKAPDRTEIVELEDYETLRGLEDKIRTHQRKNQKSIPGQKIRNAVRSTLLKVGAQNVRRKAGGLYFVPKQYQMPDPSGRPVMQDTLPTLKGLQQVLTDLYGERGDFYMIPMAADEDMKAMVAKHFAINVCEQSREAMEKALQRVRQGKGERGVRADLIANLYNDRRKLAGAVAQFDAIVDLEKSDIDKNLRDLDDALAQLQELADEPKD